MGVGGARLCCFSLLSLPAPVCQRPYLCLLPFLFPPSLASFRTCLQHKARGQHEEQVEGATTEEGGGVDAGGAGDEEAEGGGGDARHWGGREGGREGEKEGLGERF